MTNEFLMNHVDDLFLELLGPAYAMKQKMKHLSCVIGDIQAETDMLPEIDFDLVPTDEEGSVGVASNKCARKTIKYIKGDC